MYDISNIIYVRIFTEANAHFAPTTMSNLIKENI